MSLGLETRTKTMPNPSQVHTRSMPGPTGPRHLEIHARSMPDPCQIHLGLCIRRSMLDPCMPDSQRRTSRETTDRVTGPRHQDLDIWEPGQVHARYTPDPCQVHTRYTATTDLHGKQSASCWYQGVGPAAAHSRSSSAQLSLMYLLQYW